MQQVQVNKNIPF